ncbi:hypothetical protein DL764_006657 [Monosporascus ibericus]|uniref:F-box domain-containing protein n=1 Tax=Monosporascus ibericus TaxID=155417 RepID=A0A4Q4T7C2_9PEZI|nr:hypothetical protein DL764_006657 [Monosporascus ibericus]
MISRLTRILPSLLFAVVNCKVTSYLPSPPNKLLLSVFEHLVPEPLATGSSPELSHDYIQRRGTLRELCLASRRACGIVQPLRFRNHVATNGARLVILFRSMWNIPALRRCPRSFACPILLSEQDVVEGTLNCWNSNVDTLSRDPAYPENSHFLNASCVQLRQVQAPLANRDVGLVSQTSGDTDRDNHWHGVLLTYFLFWEFSGVTRLEYYRDAANWNEIEELRLYSSRMAPWSMRQLLSHCLNLRSLHWAFGDKIEWLIPTFPDRPFYESDFEPQVTSEATPDETLMAASGHLQSLHLDVMIKSTARFDSRYRVTCLSAFTSLRHLTVNTVCLLGLRPYAVDPLEKNLGPINLIDVLPPNLEKLLLIEKWDSHQIRL